MIDKVDYYWEFDRYLGRDSSITSNSDSSITSNSDSSITSNSDSSITSNNLTDSNVIEPSVIEPKKKSQVGTVSVYQKKNNLYFRFSYRKEKKLKHIHLGPVKSSKARKKVKEILEAKSLKERLKVLKKKNP